VTVRFGTDGIRGPANDVITTDLAYRLGRAVATVFPAVVYVGYDTRESSPTIAAAVVAGVIDGGSTPVNLGYFTTPGVAVIAQQRGGVGVVVSASHNPYYDNGLKVLGLGGGKLDHDTELAVTEALNAAPHAPRENFEVTEIDASAEHDYARHLRSLVPGDISPLTIVLDCANGAASHVAHELFEGTGARITTIHDQPDGRNINERCGSTNVNDLVAAVLELGADLGLAFDGDADRMISVDSKGNVRDGDDLMVVFALDFAQRHQLGGGLVVTSMSNLGLHRALKAADIRVIETDVGDRNVLRALDELAWPFGGEQSGHLIFRNLAPTGDGLLTGMMLADLVVRRGPLSELAEDAWHRVPQELVNVASEHFDEQRVRHLFNELCEVHAVSSADVRLLIRPSGTEPVVRVMIEALDADFVGAFAERLQELFVA
jgi:phosphoglucosamine mutase